jgi:CHAT domain-containing protein
VASGRLALGELYGGNVDVAVELLSDAASSAPASPTSLCDLAAASLVRNRPTDLLVALDAAQRGLALDRRNPVCRFNRALALEHLGLLPAAIEAWRAAALAEPGRAWAAEMSTRAEALVARQAAVLRSPTPDAIMRMSLDARGPLLRDSMHAVREQLENEALPHLGRACASGDAIQCDALGRDVTALVRAVAAASRDRFFDSLANELDEWRRNGPLRKAGPDAARALVVYGQALVDVDRRFSEAVAGFRAFDRSPHPFHSLRTGARLYPCIDAYYRSDHPTARTCLDALEAEASRSGFLYLQGRIDWVRAQISLTEADFPRADREFDSALDFMRAAPDRVQVAALESLKATLLDQVGELDAAWRSRIQAVRSADLGARRRHTLLNSASRSCLLQRLPLAALAFQDEAVRNAASWGHPGGRVEALLTRALIFQALGRSRDAQADLTVAHAHLDDVQDVVARSRFEAELVAGEGETLAETNPERALAAIARAIALHDDMRFQLPGVRLRHARGVAFERLGRDAEALAAYRDATGLIEQRRRGLAWLTGMQALDMAWDTYERLIARQMAQDATGDSALTTLEASRAQLTGGVPPGPMQASDIARSLPADVVIVYFSILRDETFRWTLWRGGCDVARLPNGRALVEQWVGRVRSALTTRPDREMLRRASPPLVDLIAPEGSPAARAGRLMVVPDGPLYELPVAALIDPRSGRHLVEDRPVGVAPSLAILLSSSRAAVRKLRGLDSALVVEGASGGSVAGEALPFLPGAAREVREVARAYRRAELWVADQATPRRFLEQAGAHPVVHFAGHAVANRLQPDLSRLVLSPGSAQERGWLLLRELATVSFARTGLVVLSGCETARGRVFRGEGMVSLASPFLRKGVPAVVNTLWRVDDTDGVALIAAFHAGIGAGLEPLQALQRAQREQIARSSAGLMTWAAYQYVGGIIMHHTKAGTP